jgi:hypothetical protein
MKVAMRLLIVLALLSGVAAAALRVTAQSRKVLNEFHGVKLGMKAADVTKALGKPESSSETREEYTFDGENSITIHYDGGVVKAIQIYFTDPSKAPGWTDVVGDAPIEEMANGAKAARKVVDSEKYWVSMYRSKDGTTVRITISRS